MSDLADTIAAWTGATGVVLTWLAKLVSFILRRRSRVEVRLLDGPRFTVVNRSEVPLEFRPPMWGGVRWDGLGREDGTRFIRDYCGGCYRLNPGAEQTFTLAPDVDSVGGQTLKPATVSKLLSGCHEPLCLYRLDGKLVHRIACEDVKALLRKHSRQRKGDEQDGGVNTRRMRAVQARVPDTGGHRKGCEAV